MKDAIVACSIILILLIFPLQDMRNTVINRRLEAFDTVVHNSVNIARSDGYFTPQNISSLQNRLTEIFPDAAAEISISVTTSPKYRSNEFDDRELINYDISVPVKNVILMGGFLGMNPADNMFTYRKKSFVPSERLPLP